MRIIREIQASDNPHIAKIIRQVMTEFNASGEGYSIHDFEVDDMYSAYNQQRSIYLVLLENEIVKGGAGIAQLLGADSDYCELKKMYFLPEIRHQGFASRILEILIQKAKSFSYRKMYLESTSRMHSAIKLYQKFGFTERNEFLGSTGHFSCDIKMIREL